MPTTSAEFIRQSLDDPDAFWAEQARRIDWQRPFDRVCDTSNPPFVQWFPGGLTNLDRKSTRLNSSHLPTSRMPSSA